MQKKALEQIPRALNAERQQYLATLGGLLVRSGQAEKALEPLQHALEAGDHKGIVRVWLFLALAQQKLGQDMKAQESLNKAKEAKVRLASPREWESLEHDLLIRELEGVLQGGRSTPPTQEP